MRKLFALVAALALVAVVAAPASATTWMGWGGDSAHVTNSSSSVAETGFNSQDNYAGTAYGAYNTTSVVSFGGGNISTGNANSEANAVVVANTHVGCSWCTSSWGANRAYVANASSSVAATGRNTQDSTATVSYSYRSHAGVVGGAGMIDTGNANSDSNAVTVVNTHWTGWSF